MTRWVLEASEIMGRDVLDHVTIPDRTYLSLKARSPFYWWAKE